MNIKDLPMFCGIRFQPDTCDYRPFEDREAAF